MGINSIAIGVAAICVQCDLVVEPVNMQCPHCESIALIFLQTLLQKELRERLLQSGIITS